MKIRSGFVSNSSSCSFIVKTDNLSEKQIDIILNYKQYADKLDLDLGPPEDLWDINTEETTGNILCKTIMDNFDLIGFLEYMGIPKENISETDICF